MISVITDNFCFQITCDDIVTKDTRKKKERKKLLQCKSLKIALYYSDSKQKGQNLCSR